MSVSQPLAIDAPRICCSRIDDEKYTHHYEPTFLDDGAPYDVHHFHGNCHQWRLRRVLIPVLLGLLAAFLLLCAISAVRITYFAGMDREGEEGWLGMLDNGFKIMKRAVVETSGSSDSFIHNKRAYAPGPSSIATDNRDCSISHHYFRWFSGRGYFRNQSYLLVLPRCVSSSSASNMAS
jgi:hypothetical protein